MVFRHYLAALDVLAKEMIRLCVGSVGYSAVNSLCPMHPHHVAICLSTPADASLHHPPLTIFWGVQVSKISVWLHA